MPRGKSRRRVWTSTVGAVAVAVSALVMTSATTAQAADPVTVCNSGEGGSLPSGAGPFRVVNSVGVPGGGGTVYLLYDDTYNCAVTINSGVGVTYMDVGLRQAGNSGTQAWDHGQYGQYAGPVYVSARGICVDFTGAVRDQSALVTNQNCSA